MPRVVDYNFPPCDCVPADYDALGAHIAELKATRERHPSKVTWEEVPLFEIEDELA
jgi:hypothetical protein